MAAIRGVHRLETNQWILLVGPGFGPDSLQEICSNLLSTYFLLDIAYIAARFLLKIHNLQNTMPLYEDGCQKRNQSCILAVKSGFLPELSEHLWGFS